MIWQICEKKIHFYKYPWLPLLKTRSKLSDYITIRLALYGVKDVLDNGTKYVRQIWVIKTPLKMIVQDGKNLF